MRENCSYMSRVINIPSFTRADDVVRARIPHETKVEATAVLESFGLNTSDLIRLTLTMVARNKALPAGILAKRKITTEAIAEGRRSKAKLKGYDSAKAMFADFKSHESANR
jgi:DNA-damage-inducible protein J